MVGGHSAGRMNPLDRCPYPKMKIPGVRMRTKSPLRRRALSHGERLTPHHLKT